MKKANDNHIMEFVSVIFMLIGLGIAALMVFNVLKLW